MSASDRKVILDKLGGMDQRWRTEPSAARTVRDLVWDPQGGWKTSGGFGLIYSSAASGLGAIESMHWYSDHGGARQFLIIEANNRWYQFVGAGTRNIEVIPGKGNATLDTHITPSSPYVKTQSLSYGGFLYLLSGVNPPLVFNGRYMQRAGFDGPPPPPSAVWLEHANYSASDRGIGENLEESWARRYRYSFVNERGQESPLSEPSLIVRGENTTNAKTAVGVTFATGDSTVVARRIYATHNLYDSEGRLLLTGEAQNYYFLAEIQDNIQTTYEDCKPDAYLAAVVNPDDYGPWPPGSKFIESFKGTVFLCGHSNDELRFSAVGTTEVFPPLNSIRVGDSSSGEFTGMYPTKNALVVFKRNAIFMVKGDPANGYEVFTLTKSTGCIAPDSFSEIPNLGLMFLGNEGPMLLEGALENTGTPTRVVPLWTPIPKMVERINKAAAVVSQGVIYHPDREYWLAVPWDASEKNNTVLVYHYEIGAWSYRENMPIGGIVVTADHRNQVIFGSNDASSHEGVFAYSRGISDKNGTALAPLYETTDIDFGDKFTAVVPETVTAWMVGYGIQDARIQYTANRNYKQVYSLGDSDDAEDQQDTTNAYSTLGNVDWDAGFWYNLRPVPVTFNVYTKDGAPVREFRFEISSDGRMMQIVGAEMLISVTPSDQRTEPLHLNLVVDRK